MKRVIKLDRENTNLRAMLSLKDCEIMSLKAAAAHWEAEKEKAYNKLIAVEEEVERLARKANAASAEIEKLKAELAAARAGTNAKELAETVDRLKAELAAERERANDCAKGSLRYRESVNAERDAARAEVARKDEELTNATAAVECLNIKLIQVEAECEKMVGLLRQARVYIAEHTTPTVIEAAHGGIVNHIDEAITAHDAKGKS